MTTRRITPLVGNLAAGAILRFAIPYTLADSGERFRYYTMSSVFPLRDCPSFHCFRVLPPLVAALLPFSVADGFLVAGFIFQVLAGTMLWHIADELHGSRRIAAFASAWFWVTWGPIQSFNDPLLIADPLQAFWSLAALYLLLDRRYLLALPLLVSGAAVKEMVLVIPMIYALYAVLAADEARRRPIWLAVLIAVPVATWLILRMTLSSRFGYVTYEDEGYLRATYFFGVWLPNLSTWPRNLMIAALYIFGACGGAWILGARGVFRSNRRQQALTLASLPPMLLMALYQVPDRGLAAFPYATLIPAAVYLSPLPLPLSAALLLTNAAFSIRMNAAVPWLPRMPILLAMLLCLIATAVWVGRTPARPARRSDFERDSTATRPRDGVAVGAPVFVMVLVVAVVAMQAQRARVAATARTTQWDPESFGSTRLVVDDDGIPGLAVSRDGQWVAFVGAPRDGGLETSATRALWRRRIDSAQTERLAGTEGASAPFWSPDGRAIGFFAAGKLKIVDVATGSINVLADAPLPRGAAWSARGVIVFAPDARGGLIRVADTGGPVTPVTTLDGSRGEQSHRWPSFLSDGDRFVFVIRSEKLRSSGLYLGSLSSRPPTRLSDNRWKADYSSGFLLIGREDGLYAQAFDERRSAVLGERRKIGPVAYTPNGELGAFSVSGDTLVFATTPPRERTTPETRVEWVDRAGRRGSLDRSVGMTELSAPVSGSGERRSSERAGWAIRPAVSFSPDVRVRLAIVEPPLPDNLPPRAVPTSWSPDGHVLLSHAPVPPRWDVWALTPSSGAPATRPFVHDRSTRVQAQFSPDGKWVAYTSREFETEADEVYVSPYPPTGQQWRVSVDGGAQPQWRADGRELVYVSGDRFFRSVAVETQPSFHIGPPRPLFERRLRPEDPSRFLYEYAMTKDGERFLVNAVVSPEPAASITVVTNWKVAASFR